MADEKPCGRIDKHPGHYWWGHRQRVDVFDLRPRPLVRLWCNGDLTHEG